MVSFFPFGLKHLGASEKKERKKGTQYCHVVECHLRFTSLTPDTNSQTCLLLFNRLLLAFWVQNYDSYATSNLITLSTVRDLS